MGRYIVDPRFSAMLRRLRTERGLSLRELARMTHRGKSHLHELESGAKQPGRDVAKQLDDALQAGGELAGMVIENGRTPGRASGLAVVDAFGELAPPLGADDVVLLNATVAHLVDLDNAYGADDICRLAVRAFRTAHRKLIAGAYLPAVESDVRSAVGEVAGLAAWLLYDADRQAESRKINAEALALSRLAGDRSMELLELANMAMQSVYLHRGREALQIAEGVIDSDRLSGRVGGLFEIRRARALAELGDGPRAVNAMARARAMLADGLGTRDPAWSWWVDENELIWHEGMLYASLGQWGQAVDLFRAVADREVARGRRGYYNNLAHLLDALIAVGGWRDSEPVMADLLPYVAEIGSTRTAHLLQRALALMARARVPDSVADTAEALTDAVSAVR